MDEYTPTLDSLTGKGGHANLYCRMLVEELMPLINECYRTRLGPENTALAGSSLAGSSHCTWAWLIRSSSAKWPDSRRRCGGIRELYFGQVNALVEKPPVKIWLDVGTEEGRLAVRQVRQLRNALFAKGWRPDSDLVYLEAKGGVHDENAWAERVAPC
jgi:enterochelin esterase-like enzyme